MGLLDNLKGSYNVQEQEAAERIEYLETHLRLIKHFSQDYIKENCIAAAVFKIAEDGLYDES